MMPKNDAYESDDDGRSDAIPGQLFELFFFRMSMMLLKEERMPVRYPSRLSPLLSLM